MEASNHLQPFLARVDQILQGEPRDEPEPSSFPLQVLPWLYLSSQQQSIGNPDRLQELGVTHVLTVNAMNPREAHRIQSELWYGMGIDHCYVAAYDQEGYDMIGKHWETTCRTFLQDAKKQETEDTTTSKVVVHCVAGQNRSALIVAAALVELEGWTLLPTVRHLKKLRRNVLTNSSFRKQLCELAARNNRLGNLGDEQVPGDASSAG